MANDIIDLQDLLDDFDDLCEDVSSSHYKVFENNLSRLFQFLDGKPVFSDCIKSLERTTEFGPWYEQAKSTRVGMVGSGNLEWPLDTKERLGFQLALFRAFAEGKESYSDFCSHFMDAGSRYDDMVSEINDQLFRPFARDLRKLVERGAGSAATQAAPDIPASDRYVRLDHNSPEFKQTIEALDAVIDAVRMSNEYASADPEGQEQRLAELGAGKSLLEAVRVRVDAASVLLVTALTYLATKFADATIGDLAGQAVNWIRTLLGL